MGSTQSTWGHSYPGVPTHNSYFQDEPHDTVPVPGTRRRVGQRPRPKTKTSEHGNRPRWRTGGSGQEGFDALRGDGRKPRQVHEEWAGREHVGALLQRQGMQILRRTLLSQ